MKRFWVLLPVLFLIAACGPKPGDPKSNYHLVQKVVVGQYYQAERDGARIQYSGMPNKDTVSFATPWLHSATNIYYPKDIEVVDNGLSRFRVHEADEAYVILEWLSWSGR